MYQTPKRPHELYHHGILGMKWGVRRYQNKDGSLTEAGKKKYGYGIEYDKGFSLRAGSKVNRVSMVDNEKESGRTYAAFTDKDIKKYIENGKLLTEMLGGSAYSYEYIANENLNFPSRKEKVDTYIYLMENDPSFKSLLNRNLTNKSRMAQEEAYDKFEYGLVSHNKKSKAYFDELQKRGYNAMLDDVDMKKGISDMPIIVLDRGKSLVLKKISKIE